MHLYSNSIALGWYRRAVVTLVRAFAVARWRSPQGAGTFADSFFSPGAPGRQRIGRDEVATATKSLLTQ